jgi:hypothetical protein
MLHLLLCTQTIEAGAVFLGLDNLFYTAQVLGLPTGQRISINSLEAAAKKQCSLSWHAVKAQLAKQAGSSKTQDDPYLLKVGSLFALVFLLVGFLGLCVATQLV